MELSTIAIVTNDRDTLEDDSWGGVVSEITLVGDLSADLLKGLDTFSHVEILFYFHLLPEGRTDPPTRSPRNNPKWPELGLLAQRSAHHPNPLGMTTVRLLQVSERTITVQGLDAANGTPVLDIKPVFKEFLPEDTTQPEWVSELMRNYWSKS